MSAVGKDQSKSFSPCSLIICFAFAVETSTAPSAQE
jgi:hypothetical protein